MNDELLTIQQAAALLSVSTKTLRRWEQRGLLKPTRTLGNQRRYSRADIQALSSKPQENQINLTPEVPTFQPNQEDRSEISQDIVRDEDPEVAIAPVISRDSLLDIVKRRSFALWSVVGLGTVVGLLLLFVAAVVLAGNRHLADLFHSGSKVLASSEKKQLLSNTQGQNVLGSSDAAAAFTLNINVPTFFGQKVTFLDSAAIKKSLTVQGLSNLNGGIKTNNANINAGKGKLTASNVIYSIVAGSNITISGDKQNPVLSAGSTGVSSFQGTTGDISLLDGSGISLDGLTINNTGVLSVQGDTGDVTFDGGDGIDVTGTTITNTDTGSAQNIFKTFSIDDGTTITADNNNDTVNFAAGSGITLTGDSGSKTITISGSGGGGLSGLTPNGVLYAIDSSTAGTVVGTDGTVLHGVTGGAPVFSAVDLTADVSNVLPVANGGTGVGSTPSNGQILIGNGSGYTLSTITAGSGIGLTNGTGSITLTNSGVLALTGTADQVNVSGSTGSVTLSLPQSIGQTSSPTFASATLTNNTNQLTLGTGTTGTITMAALGGNRTYIFPDASGTVCLTSGNCSGSGGALTGSGTQNYIPLFTSSSGIGDSDIYDNGKIGIGTTSPQGLFSVSGTAPGFALADLNQTGTGAILTGSASGTTRFVFDASGNLTINGGNYQIGGTTVLSSNALGTGVVSSSLTSVGALASGSIATGFGSIATGNTIQGTDITSTGTTGLTATGNGAGLTFSGSGNHIISASNGTLELGAATLTGAIAGNGQDILNLNNLSAGGTITFGGLGTGIAHISNTGVVSSAAVNLASTDVSGTLGIIKGGTNGSATPTAGAIAYGTGTAYGFSGVGTTGDVLVSGGSGTPTWVNASLVGSNYWQLNNGAIAPLNLTNDLLLGSTATGSAKFAVSGTTGNLSSVGTVTFSNLGTGVVQSNSGLLSTAVVTNSELQNSSLTISTGTGLSGGGSVSLGGTLTLTNTGVTGITGGSGGGSVTGAVILANATSSGSTLTINNASTLAKGIATFNSTNFKDNGSGTINTIQDINTGASPTFTGLTLSGLSSGVVTNTSGVLSSSAQLGSALGGTGADLSTASQYSIPYFGTTGVMTSLAPGTNGYVLETNGAGSAPSWVNSAGLGTNYWQLNNGALAPVNVSNDLLLGSTATGSAKFAASGTTGNLSTTGTVTFSSLGTGVVQSNSGLLSTGVVTNSELQNNSISLSYGTGLSGSASVALGGTLTVNNTGVLSVTGGSGGTAQSGGLTLSNATSNFSTITVDNASTTAKGIATFNSTNFKDNGSGTINTIQDINTGASPTFTGLTLSGLSSGVVTNASGVLSSVAQLGTNLGGTGADLSSGSQYSLPYFSAIGVLGGALAPGTSGFVLESNGTSSAPSWVSTASLGTNYFQLVNGAISPLNETNDLLLGSTATASAKFAFTGVAGGTPTASISAGTTGATYITGNGTLATTNKTTLTLGSASTGNIGLFGFGAGVLQSNASGLLSTGVVTNSELQNNSISLSYGTGLSGDATVALGGTLTLNNTGVTSLSGTTNQVNVSASSGSVSLSLPQDIAMTSSPTFSSLILGSGNTGTISLETLSASKSYTLPDFAGTTATICLTTGNCIGGGGGANGIGGGGSANYITMFSDSSHVTDSLLYQSNNSLGLGTTTPIGAFDIQGAPAGQALTVLNYTGTDQNILVASTSGSEKFAINNNGSFQFTGGSSFLQTVTSNATHADTYNLPDIGGGSADICLTTGNCAGSGGGISGSGTANQLAYFNGTGSITSTSTLTFDSTNGLLGIGTTSPVSTLQVTSAYGSNAALIINQQNSGNIFAASSSGTTKFIIANDGTVTDAKYTTNNGLLYTNGSGVITQAAAGTDAQVLLSNSGTPTFATLSGDATINNTGVVSLKSVGPGVGTYGSASQVPVFTLDAQGRVTGVTNTSIAIAASQITSGQLSSAQGGTGADLSTAAVGSLPYFSSTGVMSALAPSTGGFVLETNGAGNAPSWVSSASLGNNYWQLNNGAVEPLNLTNDLLLGSTATASAKFAFTGVAGGTPTASISAGTTGATYVTGNGILATTNKTSLTLGSASTGNIGLFGFGAGVVQSNASGILSIAQVTNSELQNNSVTVTAGTGLSGGGSVALGSAITLTNAGVTSITGGSGGSSVVGGVTLANATGAGSTLTIDNASTTAKGIATFNNTNFKDNGSGTINTIQDINTGASPTFTGLTLSGLSSGVVTNTSGVLSSAAQLSSALGGTGSNLSTAAVGSVPYFSSIGIMSALPIGSSGQVLSVSGGGLPQWVSTSSINFWQRANGEVSPLNLTDDLLLGSTATTSAKFAFTGVAGGTPTASIAAVTTPNSLVLDANGNVYTTGKQGLTIGSSSTGNISIFGIGTGVVQANSGVLSTAQVTNSELQNNSVTVTAGTGLSGGGAVALGSAITLTNAGVTSLIGTANQVLVNGGTSGQTGAVTLTLPQDIATTSTPTFSSLILGSGNTGTLELGTLSGSKTYDLPDFVGSTATICVSTGNCSGSGGSISGSGNANQVAFFTSSSNLSSTSNFTWDSTHNLFGIGTSSPTAPLSVAGSYGGNAAAIINQLNSGDIFTASASGTTRLTLTNGGNLNIIGGGYQIGGTSVLSSSALGTGVTGSSLTSVGALGSGSIGGSFGTISTNNSITGTTLNATTELDTGGTKRIDSSGNLSSIGTTQLNGVTYSWPGGDAAQGGYVLSSNGSGTLSWIDVSTAQSQLWQRINGLVSPTIATVDFALGGTSTSSAKFAVTNMNSGTPTASIAAVTTPNALSFDANGNLFTTGKQSLTLGAASTGNIAIGTDATARTLSLGNTTGASAVNISAGSGNINLTGATTTTGTITLPNSNTLTGVSGLLQLSNGIAFGGTTTNQISNAGAATLSSISDSGNLSFTGTNPSITNTGSNTLTLNSGSTGNIQFFSGSNTLTSGGALTLVGGITAATTGTINGINISSGTISNATWNGNIIGSLYGGTGADLHTAVQGTIPYFSSTGVMSALATGTSGQCLETQGASANPVWATCAQGANYLQLNSGALSPFSSTADFLVGGTATSSADFAFAGVDSTNPTASISAFTNGGNKNGISLSSSTSTIQALNMNNLILGGSTTGNITLGSNIAASTKNISNIGTLDLGASNISLSGNTITSGSTLTFSGATAFSDTGLTTLTTANTLGISATTLNLGNGSAATLATTGTSNLTLTAAGTGNTILSSDFNSGAYVGSSSNTPAVLSVSGGIGNNGAFIVNNTNSGDLIDASASGALKFSVQNDGTITSGKYTGTNALLYTNGGTFNQLAIGGTGTCLMGGTSLTWGACAAGANLWQENLGAVAPANITDDLLLGSTATTSAKFAFTGVAGGTPTASISAGVSGGTYLTGTGVLATTTGQTLTLGATTTGNIAIGSDATARTLSLGNTTGATTVNISAGSGGINLTGALNATGAITFSNATYTAGGLLKATAGTGALTIAAAGTDYQVPLTFNNGLTNTSNTVQLGGTLTQATSIPFANNVLTLGNNTGTGNLVVSPNAGGQAALIVNKQGGNDIFTASAAGATKFTIANNGNITANGTIAGLTGITSSGTIQFSGLSNGVVQVSSGTLSGGALNLATAGNVTGILPVANGGTGADLTSGSQNASGSIPYFNGSGVMTTLGIGSPGQVLSVSGTTPQWVSAGSVGYWQLVNGAISPINETNDLLLGNTATTSAKFAFTGVAGGTPTASISAGTTGGTYLTGTGTLGTTTRQTLTLGSSTTGDIVFQPGGVSAGSSLYLSSNGQVAIGMTNPSSVGSSALTIQAASSTGTAALDLVTTTNNASDTEFIQINNRSEFGYDGATGNAFMQGTNGHGVELQVNGTSTPFAIDSSGNTMIGTSAVSADAGQALLTVSGSASVSGQLSLYGTPQLQSTANQTLTLGGNTTGNISFQPGGVSAGSSLYLSSNGNVGIGTNAPIAPLQVNGAYAGNAAAIINQLNSGNIFTASASGATKFTIANNGNITANGTIAGLTGIISSGTIQFSGLSNGVVQVSSGTLSGGALNLATAGNVSGILSATNGGTGADLHTATIGQIPYFSGTGVMGALTAGSAGQCLEGNGAATPVWVTCAAGQNYWQMPNNGAIAPFSTTADLLVGGVATTSAKFAFINNASGTPTASIAAITTPNALSFDANGNIFTTGKQSLTLGAASTGNIAIGTDATARTLSLGNTTGASAVTISAGSGGITLTGATTVSSLSDGGNFAFTGTNPSITNTGINTLTLNSGSTGNIQFFSGSNTLTSGGALTLAGGITAATTGTINGLNISSGTIGNGTWNGNIIGSQYGGTGADLHTATIGQIPYFSGTGVMGALTAGSAGQCLEGNGAATPVWVTCAAGQNYWQMPNNGAITTFSTTADLLLGGVATTSAKFAFTGVDTTTPVASISAQNGNGTNGLSLNGGTSTLQSLNRNTLTLGGTTTGDISFQPGGKAVGTSLYLASNGNVGIGTTSPAQPLQIASNAPSGVDSSIVNIIGSITDPNNYQSGLYSSPSFSPSGVSVQEYAAIKGTANSATGNLANGILDGVLGGVFFDGGGNTLGSAIGLNGAIYTGAAGAVINNAYGEYIHTPDKSAGGSVTNGFGIYLENQVTGGTSNVNLSIAGTPPSGNYSIYNASAYPNYFAGRLGIGTTAIGNAELVINQPNGTGDIITASQAGTTKFTVNNNGNIQFTGSTSFLNTLTTAATAARTYTFPDATGNVCLSTNNCGYTSGQNYWQMPNPGAITTFSTTADLLLGGVATTSAKFAFTGVDTTTPVASISALNGNGTNGLSLNGGTSTIQSLNMNTLTLGGATTGFVAVASNRLSLTGAAPIIDSTAGVLSINTISGQGVTIGTGASTTTIGGTLKVSGNIIQDSGAATRIQFSGNNVLLNPATGNVAIGTSTPLATLDVRATSATTAIASVAGATNYAGLIVNNSGSGDIFTASSGGSTRFTVKNSGTVVIGNSTNGITFDPTGSTTAIYTGSARPTKQIVLSAEYSGAVLTASGSAAANGFMTSDASPSAKPAAYDFENYYQWQSTQTSGLQSYTVAVRVTLPNDFSAWGPTNPVTVDYNTSTSATNANLDIYLYNTTSATPVAYHQNLVSSGPWATNNISTAELTTGTAQWNTAGQTAVFYLTLQAQNNAYVQVGDIKLNYLAQF